MKLIDIYISRAILSATGVVALVVGALVMLSRIIGELGNLGDGDYGLLDLLGYVLLHTPSDLLLVLPVIALLGSLLALGSLAAGSELVVLRSAGVSMARLAGSASVAGLVLAVLAIVAGEYLGPAGVREADALRETARDGSSAQSIDDGLWLRQDNTIVRIGGTLPGGHVTDVAIYRLDDEGRLRQTIQAPRATLGEQQLMLENPRFTRIRTDSTEAGAPEQLAVDIALGPEVLGLAVIEPSELSSPGLWRYIDYLQTNNVDAGDYQLALWRNIVNPITIWVLTVFALPFAFGSLRSAGAGQRLFVGGLIGLVFYLVNEIVASSGPVYGLPPWLAASLPTVLLGAGGLYWMRRLN